MATQMLIFPWTAFSLLSMNPRIPILLSLLCLLAWGCSSKDSPTNTTNVTNNYGIIVDWPFIGAMTYSHGGVVNGQVWLADSNGPVTNAAITFTYNGGSTPVTFQNTVNQSVTVNAAVILTVITGHYESDWFASDIVGQACTISAALGGTTYSSAITIAGHATFSPGASGITCLWAGGGADTVTAYPGPLGLGTAANPPYYIDQSQLPGYTAGSYAIVSSIEKDGSFSGRSSSSYFNSLAEGDTVY